MIYLTAQSRLECNVLATRVKYTEWMETNRLTAHRTNGHTFAPRSQEGNSGEDGGEARPEPDVINES